MQHLGAGTPPTRDCDPPKGMARHWDTPFTPPKKKKKGGCVTASIPLGPSASSALGTRALGSPLPLGGVPIPPPFSPPPSPVQPCK